MNQTEDYPELFLEGRLETLDNSYFPTKGISTGIRGRMAYTGFVPDHGAQFLGMVSADITIPIAVGRHTIIGQGYSRMVFSRGSVPFLYSNMLGTRQPDIRG